MFETILIANTAEAFQEILIKDSHTKQGKERIRHELALSQRAFFWGADDKIVITPYTIHPLLLEANKRNLGFSNVVNLAPVNSGINLSLSIIEDKGLFKRIVGEIRNNPGIVISPYAVTQNFLQLVSRLEKLGLDFVVNEKPEDKSLWTASYLDSKAGFRTEMLKLGFKYKEVKVPEGFVAQDAKEAQQITEWFYENGHSSVLKANFGESGWGMKILKLKEYSSLSIFQKAVSKILRNDVIWQNTSIIVEQFVESDIEVAGGSPSTEMFVTDEGTSFLYHCGQILNQSGVFFGVEMGRDVLSDSLSKKLLAIGNIIGKRYWELGYRGRFDIDFIISKSGEIYVAETNTRRTGGTHVYDLTKYLFGRGCEKETYLLSHDSFLYHNKRMEVQELLKKLKPILYPVGNEKKGVITTLISEWSPILGYIVVASNRSEGQKIQKKLFSTFNK